MENLDRKRPRNGAQVEIYQFYFSELILYLMKPLFVHRPSERSGEDVDIILSRLREVKAFHRFPPPLLLQICACAFYECLEKGITCMYTHSQKCNCWLLTIPLTFLSCDELGLWVLAYLITFLKKFHRMTIIIDYSLTTRIHLFVVLLK